MKVLVGSQNPVKIEAVREAFSKYFAGVDVVGIKVDSKVPDQPINDQTFEGARNRALELQKLNDIDSLGAEFFVGIEGGIKQAFSRWFAFGGMCIIDAAGRTGYGTSGHFELPHSITARLLKGAELGDVMDEISGEHNVKQKGGAVSILTKNVMDRKSFYVHGLISALIPFINKELYLEH